MQLSQFQQIAGGYINKAQSLMKTWPSKLMAAGWMDGGLVAAATGSGSEWRQLKDQDVYNKKKASVRTGASGKTGRASRNIRM